MALLSNPKQSETDQWYLDLLYMCCRVVKAFHIDPHYDYEICYHIPVDVVRYAERYGFDDGVVKADLIIYISNLKKHYEGEENERR